MSEKPTELTATVSEPDSDAREATKALIGTGKFDVVILAKVAREIAYDLLPLDQILAKYEITNAQFDWLSTHNKFFISALETAVKEWHSVGKTTDRLRLQSAIALEEQMPKIASRMGQHSEKLGDVVEAAKLFAKMAGADTDNSRGNTLGERFTINIDLGGDTRVTIGPQIDQAADLQASGDASLQGNGIREINRSEIQQLTVRERSKTEVPSDS